MTSKHGQAGFFTIDALFGLIVMAVMLSLAGWWMLSFANQQDYRIAAEHQRTATGAFAKYLKDNYTTVLNNAGPTTPVRVTVEMMRNTGYLPSGFSPTNGFGQTILGLARRVNTNQLEAIVITTGGQVIPELGIRTIAEHLGAPGGFISALRPGVVQGVRGGWEVALSNYGSNPGQGHTASALFLMDGRLANDYLYRNAVPGRPELNRMNTAIDMGGNDLNNAGSVTAAGDITTRSGWFRSQNDTGWYNERWGGGFYQSDADWVRLMNDKGLFSGGKLRGGSLQSDGRVTVGEFLDIESTAIEGQACPKIGLQSKNNLGAPLTCQCQSQPCQTGIWSSISTNVAYYQFNMSGVPFSYYGFGKIQNGQFWGDAWCTYTLYCGTTGYNYCGNSTTCVNSSGQFSNNNGKVGLAAMPVYNVVKMPGW